VSARLLAVVLSLAALALACDSGSDSTSSPGPGRSAPSPTDESERETAPAPGLDDFLPEVVEACRAVYGRLPADEQAATTEDAFVVECLAAVSTRPDPFTGVLS
jgi:hypothetical protein